MSRLGERIRAARMSRGWSLREMERACRPYIDLNYKDINRIELSQRKVDAERELIALARVFGSTPNDLLGWDDT